MQQYRLWVRINPLQTTQTIISADNAFAAKALGEAMYGVGNVLSYTRIS